ncbi:MAG: ABC transporter permease subunit, partial [Halanaerobiales bacterium]
VAMVIGGIGSIYGALAGGLIVGLAMEIAAGFIPPTYKLGVAFLMMIVVLMWKPEGIFQIKK